MAGKGSTRRPSAISKREVDERWEKTFGKRAEAKPPRPVIHTRPIPGGGAWVWAEDSAERR